MSQSRAVVAERGVMEAAMRAADQRVRAQAAREGVARVGRGRGHR